MSRRLPALKPKDVLRVLEREGFTVHHTSGSHYVLKHPNKKDLRVTLPWHGRDLKRGTRSSVIQQAGYTTAEVSGIVEVEKQGTRHAPARFDPPHSRSVLSVALRLL